VPPLPEMVVRAHGRISTNDATGSASS